MDPISTIQTLAGVVKYLWEVSEKMKENKEECQGLCKHIEHILEVIRSETKNKSPPKLSKRLDHLARCALLMI